MSKARIPDVRNRRVLPQDRMGADDQFETAFLRDHPVVWLVTLLGPFALTAGILAFLWVGLGSELD